MGIVHRHLIPAFAPFKPWTSITSDDVQRAVDQWKARQAPATVARQYSVLRAVFNYAVNRDWLVKSPCRRIHLPDAYPREARILDGDDLERLADAMGAYAPMVYLAVLGLRWGEIAGLRVGRLDFFRHRISISTQRTRGENGRMIEQVPKTKAGQRSFGVPDWITEMLSDHLAARGVTGSDPDAFVFTSPSGSPLHLSNFRRRVWLPAVEAAGFPGLTFHDLKHTAGTALVSGGVDVKTAQVRLGHANPQTTLRVYAQATERADRQAAETVGDAFRPRAKRAPEALPVSD